MKVTLIIPTLDEIDGMKVIMPRIKKEWYDQLIIPDGGSIDGTIECAQKMGYFAFVQKKPGIRNAYTEALPYAEGDIIVTFSPDGNCIPELIPKLIDKIKEGYDMVIASRYLGSARSYDDNIITAFGNWFFTKTINLLFGGKYTDALVIFRAYKTKLIYDLELHKDEGYVAVERLFNTHLSWEPLLSVRAAKRKIKVTEIPGDEPPRLVEKQEGLRLLKWAGAYYLQFLQEFLSGN